MGTVAEWTEEVAKGKMINRWSSPHFCNYISVVLCSLHKAYSDCSGEEEKVTLLEYLRSGNCNR